MTALTAREGQWITIGPNHIPARVHIVVSPAELIVDYLQGKKPTRDTVSFRGGCWVFSDPDTSGRTLSGSEAGPVLRGPPRP